MKHSTNICFIANYSYTYLYHELAKSLRDAGIQVFWIANNRKLYNFLTARYDPESVLFISRKHFHKTNRPVADFKLHELIYGDRVLRYEPQNGLAFLQNIQRPIYDFLQHNQIRVVMGELTWAHEILIHRMCRQRPELNCSFISPHVVRIPDNRFAFFTDERQCKLLEFWHDTTCTAPLQPAKPQYLELNDEILKKGSSISGRLDRARRFFSNENMDFDDPTMLVNQWWRFASRTREEWNRLCYPLLVERTPFNAGTLKPYVFYAMHKQPESSVDVYGRYYEDQLQLIKNLWRALPQGWKLLVKEHTNAIGDRGPGFYKTLRALPNVEIIEETVNSYDIIEQAELVATVTGTVAYEAALMQVPAITFAPVFFNRINYCRQATLEDLSRNRLDAIACDLRNQPDNRLEFSDYLLRNSFEGRFYDPQTTSESLSPENVQKLSSAIARAVFKLTGANQPSGIPVPVA
ncbi:MAG: hypothetical protein D6714_08250 [Bacteroidetes bacterium]|nr:MAG: hypothetical protein D6714_08250 [Bacteroidota bacterium]